MTGPHDLGGQTGFGPISPCGNSAAFAAEWEKRVLGLTLCVSWLGLWTIDEFRYALESIDPVTYFSVSYFERWLIGLQALLDEKGLTETDSKSFGDGSVSELPIGKILRAVDVDTGLAAGPSDHPCVSRPRFSAGDRVRTKAFTSSGHTRLPAYARAKSGVVESVQGFYTFPDDNAHHRGANPQWLYTVVFDGRTLWGSRADEQLTTSIDAWESYLDAR
jgi:nitrile hydratase beta subunit